MPRPSPKRLLRSLPLLLLTPSPSPSPKPSSSPGPIRPTNVIPTRWRGRGGVGPFTAIVTPQLQMPFVYNIPNSSFDNATGIGSYNLEVQMRSGTYYVIWMSDAEGVGTGGSSKNLIVQGYNQDACLSTANRNQTTLDFSFEVFASNIVQCQESFQLRWENTGIPPYSMTVLPLDQSFDPFDVNFGNNTFTNWRVNLKAGTQFTIQMNDARGYGFGGTAQSYTVNSTADGDTSCFDGGSGATITPGISHTASDTISRTSSLATGTGGSTPGGQDDPPGPLSKGALYAVAAIAAVVGIAVTALLFICCIWRRRRQNVQKRTGTKPKFFPFMVRKASDQSNQNRLNQGVDLWDGGSSLNENEELSPAVGGRAGRNFEYEAVPFTMAGHSRDEFGRRNQGAPGVPGSISGTATSAGEAGRGAGSTSQRGRPGYFPYEGYDSRSLVHENPFEGRELGPEEAAYALANRRLPSSGSAAMSPVDGNSLGGTPLLGHAGLEEGISPGSYTSGQGGTAAQLRKEEEAALDLAINGRGGGRSATEPQDGSTWMTGTNSNVHSNAVPTSAYSSTQPTFIVTNAGEGDPILAPPPSATLPSGTPGSRNPANSGPRRIRLVDPGFEGQPRFVRHADAGRVRGGQDEEVIDLPPLYTDLVPGEGPGQDSSTGPDSALSSHPRTGS